MVNDVLEVKAFCDNRNEMCIVNLWGVSVGEKRREEKRRIKSPSVRMCCTGYDTGCMVVWLRGVCVKESIHVFYCYCFPSLFYFLCLFSSFPSSLSSSYFFY